MNYIYKRLSFFQFCLWFEISLKDTVMSLSVVSNNPDYLQNYEKKFKTKKIS